MEYTLIEKNIYKSIYQDIYLILFTQKGTDPHRPEFGSDLFGFIDQPINNITAGKIIAEVKDALETWEPRINVQSVDVTPDVENAHISLTITWKLKETMEEFSSEYEIQ